VDEIVKLAREFVEKYNIEPQKALEYAITNVEIQLEREERGKV